MSDTSGDGWWQSSRGPDDEPIPIGDPDDDEGLDEDDDDFDEDDDGDYDEDD